MSSKVPYIPQMEAVECGAACLASILAHWGHHAPLQEVRERCQVTRDGANGAAILQAGRDYGLEAEAYALEAEHLNDLPLPAILHWEFRHFVVLERLTRKGGWLVDPARGRVHVTTLELSQSFTGVALCFAPDDDLFQLRAKRRLSLARYRELLTQLKPSLLQVLGASFLLQMAGLTLPMANHVLVDRVLLAHQEPWLWGIAIALGLAVVSQALLTMLRGYVLQGIRSTLDRSLMIGFVRHMASLPIAFFLQRHPGDLIQRVESNAMLRDIFSSRSLSALMDAFLLVGSGTLMLVYSPLLGCLVLLVAAIRVGVLMMLRQVQEQSMAGEMAASGMEQGLLVEALSGLETVKATGSQAYLLDRWSHRMVLRLNRGQERLRISAASGQAMTFLQGVSMALVLGVGGSRVITEQMTLGAFTAFLTLQQIFMTPLEGLLGAITDFQYLSVHLSRLDDVLETAAEPSGTLRPGPLTGEIRLENISFRYAEGSPWVLKNIDLHIHRGEKIALVGRTGAGKTTLARLLLGMHPPTEGTLRFDGTDLTELDIAWVRGQLGVVPQDSVLLNDTVRVNLALGDPHLPLERLQEAARRACVDHVIDALPEGWDTRLGQNASILSGGERQRLCLARALAPRPAILLLDEATSSLDLETEAKVHAGLAELGCTRILIAHRLETVKDADRILVLEEGRLVQSGAFDELMVQAGPFQDVVRAMETSRG